MNNNTHYGATSATSLFTFNSDCLERNPLTNYYQPYQQPQRYTPTPSSLPILPVKYDTIRFALPSLSPCEVSNSHQPVFTAKNAPAATSSSSSSSSSPSIENQQQYSYRQQQHHQQHVNQQNSSVQANSTSTATAMTTNSIEESRYHSRKYDTILENLGKKIENIAQIAKESELHEIEIRKYMSNNEQDSLLTSPASTLRTRLSDHPGEILPILSQPTTDAVTVCHPTKSIEVQLHSADKQASPKEQQNALSAVDLQQLMTSMQTESQKCQEQMKILISKQEQMQQELQYLRDQNTGLIAKNSSLQRSLSQLSRNEYSNSQHHLSNYNHRSQRTGDDVSNKENTVSASKSTHQSTVLKSTVHSANSRSKGHHQQQRSISQQQQDTEYFSSHTFTTEQFSPIDDDDHPEQFTTSINRIQHNNHNQVFASPFNVQSTSTVSTCNQQLPVKQKPPMQKPTTPATENKVLVKDLLNTQSQVLTKTTDFSRRVASCDFAKDPILDNADDHSNKISATKLIKSRITRPREADSQGDLRPHILQHYHQLQQESHQSLERVSMSPYQSSQFNAQSKSSTFFAPSSFHVSNLVANATSTPGGYTNHPLQSIPSMIVTPNKTSYQAKSVTPIQRKTVTPATYTPQQRGGQITASELSMQLDRRHGSSHQSTSVHKQSQVTPSSSSSIKHHQPIPLQQRFNVQPSAAVAPSKIQAAVAFWSPDQMQKLKQNSHSSQQSAANRTSAKSQYKGNSQVSPQSVFMKPVSSLIDRAKSTIALHRLDKGNVDSYGNYDEGIIRTNRALQQNANGHNSRFSGAGRSYAVQDENNCLDFVNRSAMVRGSHQQMSTTSRAPMGSWVIGNGNQEELSNIQPNPSDFSNQDVEVDEKEQLDSVIENYLTEKGKVNAVASVPHFTKPKSEVKPIVKWMNF